MDRIDKILAHHGFGSRKDVKKLLRDEQVSVNGKFIYDPGFQLDISQDEVIVSGEKIRLQHDVYTPMSCARIRTASTAPCLICSTIRSATNSWAASFTAWAGSTSTRKGF